MTADSGRDPDPDSQSPAATSPSGPQEHARPRKRTRRACDKCSTSRTRCNGEYPCRRCQDYGYTCRYNRQVKKRGRLPASASTNASTNSDPKLQPTHASSQQSSPSLLSPPHAAPNPPAFYKPTSEPPPEQTASPFPSVQSYELQPTSEARSQQRISAALNVSSLVHQIPPAHQYPYGPVDGHFRKPRSRIASMTGPDGLPDPEAPVSDDSAGYPSPANGATANDYGTGYHRYTPRPSTSSRHRHRESFGGISIAETNSYDYGTKAPTEECSYKFLHPVLPYTCVVDDVLTYILLSIAVSGGDFKSDSHKWWSKATRLAFSLKMNREDESCPGPLSPCANPLCVCRREQDPLTLQSVERREERRRVFWLLYSLDRHLSLSFNTILSIPDSYCEVYTPLPEYVWENLDSIPLNELPVRHVGPPTLASGTGFFESFLPLMAILGDIIELHHRRHHPRLGGLDDIHSVMVISKLLADFELSLDSLGGDAPLRGFSDMPMGMNGGLPPIDSNHSRIRLVKAYSTHILHVLHVLLHGKWDAISMLDDGDDWITSKRFTECASHAISASQSVSTILTIDPELTFMSYLFGIYLLQGSFILLLFADRMPQLGPNESVEQACENIIRAHEVCVVTLSTEFQKNFRRVVRSTLYAVRGAGTTNLEEHRARRRALSLYRWTKGARGLGL
ncbi:transcriptional activator xlnR [Akanthomyces lecanii RCEF 1005]|uniref:Transcriptional activator xlnR n=1 Tax=Akanthomyces lecanii RCEF 1005 TaxID=1081108 RepID=A0A162J5Q0_CORDF|nr:transcriptional activator xlnR [Akanthomyces lecanii RCEF 1005]